MKTLFEDTEMIEMAFGEKKPITEGLTKPDLNKPIFKMMPDKAKRISDDKCPMCNSDIKEEDFTDVGSKREYTTSGMCQKCIDKVYKK